MGRIPLIAGNWKMNTTPSEGVALAVELKGKVARVEGVEVVIAPPSTHLFAIGEEIMGTSIKLAAQNFYPKDSGAYTGEVSPPMLRDLGCKFAIIGHSERRQYFGETDESVNEKMVAAINYGIAPIACVGETLKERDAGKALDVINSQLDGALKGLDKKQAGSSIIAYEPVWAIGTGKTASDEQAQEVHAFIRKRLKEVFDEDFSERIRILYGGSVNPDNVEGLMAQPDIDGALVGGASLKADSFEKIINFKRG